MSAEIDTARRRKRIRLMLGSTVLGLLVLGAWISPVRLIQVDPSRTDEGAEGELVIISYNLNYGMSGAAGSLDVLDASGADVMLLQETTEGWEAAVRARFGETHPHQMWRSPGPAFLADGLAIVSRHPFVRAPQLSASPTGWFDAMHATLRLPSGELEVLNVHLEPPVSIPAIVMAGANHAEEMRAHLEALSSDSSRWVIAGDFNEERGGALAMLEELGLVDAILEFEGSRATWNGPLMGFDGALHLDHMLHGEGWVSVGAQVVENGDSDHRAVIGRFVSIP